MTGWNDINADGLPEIPEILFSGSHGGTSVCAPLMMVQIQLDGRFSQVPLPECAIAVHDADRDGNAELMTLDSYRATACEGARGLWGYGARGLWGYFFRLGLKL